MLTRFGRSWRGLAAAATVAALASALAPAPSAAAIAPVGQDAVVERYARALGTINGDLTVVARHALAERLLLLARYYELDPRLLAALVGVESSWRSRAVSPVGALGFGQLMPSTAASLDVVALEPYENLDGTARYLRRLLNRYPTADRVTRVRLALASYNAGPAAVSRYHGVPPYRETQAYVQNVVHRWQRLIAALEIPGAGLLDAHAEPPRVAVTTAVTATAAATAPARKTRIVASAAIPSSTITTTKTTVTAKTLTSTAVTHRHAKLAKHPRKPVRIVASARPYHSPYLDAMHPDSLPLEPAQPVRWERSRSPFARLLGLRHRVGATPQSGGATPQSAAGSEAAPSAAPPAPPARDYP